MSNTYLTSSLISKEAVAIFEAENSFMVTAHHEYENMFNDNTYKSGDTINVRLDNFYVGARGDTVTAEDIVEASVPLTIQPLYSVPITYKPTDLQREIADFGAEFIQPAVRRIVKMINSDIATASLTQVAQYTGDITATLNSFTALNAVNPLMDTLNMRNNMRYLSLDPFNAYTVQGNSTIQNSFVSPLNKDVTMDAQMGRLAGLDIFKDTSIVPFISGTHAAAGNITVKTQVTSGSTIVVTGLTPTTGTFNVGDVFKLAGVFEYDQIGRAGISVNKAFTVTAVSGPADGSGDITLTVFPEIVNSGPRQNFITPGTSPNAIPAATVLTVNTNTTTGFINNIAYTDRGLIACMPPLERMDAPDSYVMSDKKSGVSIRVSKTADVLNNLNVMRLDAQVAYRWIPNQAVRLLAKVAS